MTCLRCHAPHSDINFFQLCPACESAAWVERALMRIAESWEWVRRQANV